MAESNRNELIFTFTLDELRDNLQTFGYRVEMHSAEATGATLLRSATGGMAFDIRPGNRLLGETPTYADVSFLAAFSIQGGELPVNLVNSWNNLRRFGRLHLDQGFLLLDLDVSVAGGVTRDYLRAQMVIWDQLLQSLIAYLRNELPRLVVSAAVAAPPANTAPAALAG
jgi:hypothetical protein